MRTCSDHVWRGHAASFPCEVVRDSDLAPSAPSDSSHPLSPIHGTHVGPLQISVVTKELSSIQPRTNPLTFVVLHKLPCVGGFLCVGIVLP